MRYARFKFANNGTEVEPDRPVSDSKIVRYQPGGAQTDVPGGSGQFFMVDGKPMSQKQIFDSLKDELGAEQGLARFKQLMGAQAFAAPSADAGVMKDDAGNITGTYRETPYTSRSAMAAGGRHFAEANRLTREAEDVRKRGGSTASLEEQAAQSRAKGIAAQGYMGRMFKNTIQGGSDRGQVAPKQDVNRFLTGLSEYR